MWKTHDGMNKVESFRDKMSVYSIGDDTIFETIFMGTRRVDWIHYTCETIYYSRWSDKIYLYGNRINLLSSIQSSIALLWTLIAEDSD